MNAISGELIKMKSFLFPWIFGEDGQVLETRQPTASRTRLRRIVKDPRVELLFVIARRPMRFSALAILPYHLF